MNDSYTYELAYPESMGGKVFYVGQGSGNRWLVHEAEARRGVSSEKCDIIRSIWACGEQVVRRKVAENIDDGASRRLEQQLIVRYGLRNLTNQRGQGRSVYIQVMVTKEVAAWVNAQKIQYSEKSISDVLFRLLEQVRLSSKNEFPDNPENSLKNA